MTCLGIIAGGGELPMAIAESATAAGISVFVVALQGIADADVGRFRHEWVSLGQAGRIARLLRQTGCEEVVLAGKVARPTWKDLKFDTKGMMILPKAISAARQGDDALLRAVVSMFESEGFRVVGVPQAAPALLADLGVVGRNRPSAQDSADIALGVEVVSALGSLDIGQAAIACEGLVLAVEAAEGTDATIARVGSLPESLRGSARERKGVLVKARKPTQDGLTDLPVVGAYTVENAAAVGLAGIAVEAGAVLMLDKKNIVETADRLGLFVFGFIPQSAS